MSDDHTNVVTIGHFLTDEQIKQAIEIFHSCLLGSEARDICDKVIRPNIEDINYKTGQENDPRYLGYVVAYALTNSFGDQKNGKPR